MVDMKKVEKGLDLCLTGDTSLCKDCPYDAECTGEIGTGGSPLRRDALELIRYQYERINELEERRSRLLDFDGGEHIGASY